MAQRNERKQALQRGEYFCPAPAGRGAEGLGLGLGLGLGWAHTISGIEAPPMRPGDAITQPNRNPTGTLCQPQTATVK